MAGLFDDKSLKAPPLMGAKARNKLNKHGYYRMPPNMKGIHSAAEGGLGGAITKGRKLRGYAEGGLVDITDQEPNEIRGIGGSDMLIGGSGDDDLGVGGIAPTPLDDEQPNYEEALSDVEKKARINQGTANLGQIMAAMQQKNALTQQYLDNYKQSREGGINLPALQFAAGLMSPTRTGSFGESMGAGIGMGASALAQQRKEDDAYNALKTKLGIDAAGQNVDDLIKLQDIDAKRAYNNALLGLRMQGAGNKTAQKANEYAEKANVKLGEQYQKTADASRELGEGLTQLEQILPDLPESPATDWLTNIDVFNALPMTKAKGEAEKIIKQTIIPKVKNLGVNPSNRDLIFTQDAFVKSGSTPRANQRALLAGKLFADRIKEMNDIYNDMYSSEYYAENPRELKRDFNKKIDALPSIAEAVDAKLPPEKSGRNSPVSESQMNQAPTSSNIINFDDLPE